MNHSAHELGHSHALRFLLTLEFLLVLDLHGGRQRSWEQSWTLKQYASKRDNDGDFESNVIDGGRIHFFFLTTFFHSSC